MSRTSSAILFWNARAIAMLKDGEITSSISILKKALDDLKNELKKFEISQPTGDANVMPIVRSINVVEDEDIIEDSNQLFDFFPKAFEVASGASEQRAVVALLYNLAFAFDVKAMFSEDPESAHYAQDRAIDLYTTALRVASTSWNSDDMNAMACVTVALVNNLGRLQSLQLSFVDTKHLLKLATDLLNSPNASGISDVDRLVLNSSIAPFVCLGNVVLSNAPMA